MNTHFYWAIFFLQINSFFCLDFFHCLIDDLLLVDKNSTSTENQMC